MLPSGNTPANILTFLPVPQPRPWVWPAAQWAAERIVERWVERFTPARCPVIVNRSSEVLNLADRSPVAARTTARRDAAFLLLADQHLDRAYRLARAILHNPVEAQDAAHDAFVQAWGKWESLRDPGRFEPWFDRILVNTCRNRLRSKRWLVADISAEVTLATSDPVGPTEDREVIGAAIAGLTPDHQVVVALRFYRDLSVGDIASRLGIPEGTVRSRIHYALRRLQEAIEAAERKGTAR